MGCAHPETQLRRTPDARNHKEQALVAPAGVLTKSPPAKVACTPRKHSLALAPAGGEARTGVLVRSSRTLASQEAGGLRARRINLVTMGAQESISSLAWRTAYNDFQLARFLGLNGPHKAATPPAGVLVKIVEFACALVGS